MSDDAGSGWRGTVILGRILGVLAIGFLLVLIGVIVASSVALRGDTATALFEISYDLSDSDSRIQSLQEYEILKKSQIALLKSNFVLSAAIRPPGIASLSILAGEEDPVKWLQENLVVDYPQDGEILSISLTGGELPEDLVRLVDAVAKAYKDEVLNQMRMRRLAARDLLARNLEIRNKDLKRKLEEYLDIAKEIGNSVGVKGELLQQISAKQLDRIEDEIVRLETSLALEVGEDDAKREAIGKRVEQLTKQKAGLMAELANHLQRIPDLEAREFELKQLQHVSDDLSAKLDWLDVEASSPDRIRQIQAAVVARD
jgi:hypothetical protein